MKDILLRLRFGLIAIVALAMSASLAFGAQAPAGYAAGGSYADTSEPVETAGDEDLTEDEDTDEDSDEDSEEDTDEDSDEDTEGATEEEAAEEADNCLTDPTTLTAEELAAMSHGSIVCWAAHQETPEGYANHGAWVREWAHFGKGGGDVSATKSNGKAKGHANKP